MLFGTGGGIIGGDWVVIGIFGGDWVVVTVCVLTRDFDCVDL